MLLIFDDVQIGVKSIGTNAFLLASPFFNLPHPLL